MKKRPLDKTDAMPLYEQAAKRLRDAVVSGEIAPGERIPNEQELCAAFGVSRITVRRAVADLCGRGILEKKQGKGTFAAVPGNTLNFEDVSSFHDACRRLGLKVSTRVIHVKMMPADERDIEDLHLRHGQEIVETYRLRYADRVPVMLEKNHFSSAYSYLTECDLSGSLYSLLREFGVEPGKAIHDISLGNAGQEAGELLGIAREMPVIRLREVIYDTKGRPLHNSDQWIRGDRFVFRI